MIQNKNHFKTRFPFATLAFALILAFVYFQQSHPHTGVQIGQYFLSALSSYNIKMFFGEELLLIVSGSLAEQFLPRFILVLFLIGVGAGGDALVEITNTNTLVLGLSAATVGLLGFGILAVFWYFLYDHENMSIRIILSAFIAYAFVGVFDTFWGIFVHQPLFYGLVYHPHTAYVAHLFGISAGLVLWIVLHEILDTQ